MIDVEVDEGGMHDMFPGGAEDERSDTGRAASQYQAGAATAGPTRGEKTPEAHWFTEEGLDGENGHNGLRIFPHHVPVPTRPDFLDLPEINTGPQRGASFQFKLTDLHVTWRLFDGFDWAAGPIHGATDPLLSGAPMPLATFEDASTRAPSAAPDALASSAGTSRDATMAGLLDHLDTDHFSPGGSR